MKDFSLTAQRRPAGLFDLGRAVSWARRKGYRVAAVAVLLYKLGRREEVR